MTRSGSIRAAVLCLAVLAALAATARATRGSSGSNAAQFVGEWANDDSQTRSETRTIIGASGGWFLIYGYGSCTPTECDWAAGVGGPLRVPFSDGDDGRLDVVWNFGFKTTTQALTLTSPTQLVISEFDHYTDGSGRTDRSETMTFHRTTPLMTFHQVTVVVTGDGSVESDPAAVACPGSCATELAEGSQVTLTATPALGHRFVTWQGACTGTLVTCVLSVAAPISVSATFAPLPVPCVVPRLKGLVLADGRRLLAASHCGVGTVRFARARQAKGHIVASVPGAGARLAPGARVGLVVSRGR